MALYPPPRRRSKLPLVIVFLVMIVAGVAAAMFFIWPRLESVPPQIVLTPDSETVGVAPLSLQILDEGTGVASINVTLSQGGTTHALASEQFSNPVRQKSIDVNPAKLAGLTEGSAVLRVVARDAALLRGNEAVFEKKLLIDRTPPTLDLIADDRYVNFGGVGVIVYKSSPDTATSGVKIGDRFFAGVAGQVKNHPEYFIAMFAHPYDVAPDVRPSLVATDSAGNTREMRLAYELKNVRYKKSTLALTEAFLQNKVAPLLTDAAARQGAPNEVFVAVNRQLRKENEEKITALTKKVTPTIQWSGAFAQLSNSKVEANFADQRTYTWNGQPIDHAVHLGYDLSVTKNTPVEAANSGTVVFAGDLGIYGNSVMLDHGLGLFTLYSHLSAIDVKLGDSIHKRGILGKTGETGLAAGDHLHFGVYLQGVAVLPVEWWDQKWIDDNITPKLQGLSGQEIAETQKPSKGSKAPQKTKSKRHR